jgi:hypothetical protein
VYFKFSHLVLVVVGGYTNHGCPPWLGVLTSQGKFEMHPAIMQQQLITNI